MHFFTVIPNITSKYAQTHAANKKKTYQQVIAKHNFYTKKNLIKTWYLANKEPQRW